MLLAKNFHAALNKSKINIRKYVLVMKSSHNSLREYDSILAKEAKLMTSQVRKQWRTMMVQNDEILISETK